MVLFPPSPRTGSSCGGSCGGLHSRPLGTRWFPDLHHALSCTRTSRCLRAIAWRTPRAVPMRNLRWARAR